MPNGWFVCMWNHRDQSDSTQKQIEEIIKNFIPNYNYGLRRKAPNEFITNCVFFSSIKNRKYRFVIPMKGSDIIDAWRSHDTLFRQSNGKFDHIINSIADFLTEEYYHIPYFTRCWFTRLSENN